MGLLTFFVCVFLVMASGAQGSCLIELEELCGVPGKRTQVGHMQDKFLPGWITSPAQLPHIFKHLILPEYPALKLPCQYLSQALPIYLQIYY